MIRRTKRTDLEVRQDSVISEQDKMIRSLTEELMHARLDERHRIYNEVRRLHTAGSGFGQPGDWDAAIETVLEIISPKEEQR